MAELLGTTIPLLGTTIRFPRRLIEERRITFVKVGRHVRIPESAVAAYIRANTVEPVRVPGPRLKAVA
ncbi:excisionase family DNA-binding protein [Streptomyces sp. NPDC093261]|uniref:excisionase family DNA-binding protein n=1 Tax=Streptomyces sp. NPDC093261 TaxID=3366037 RepID=UPI0038059C6B